VIAHDHGDGELSAIKPQFRCRIVTITMYPTMTRAIPAAYSLAVGSVNRDAGKLTNTTVAAINAIVIARPIQVLRRRIFLEFTIVARNQILVMANLDSKLIKISRIYLLYVSGIVDVFLPDHSWLAIKNDSSAIL
jgi:hypothetical protein